MRAARTAKALRDASGFLDNPREREAVWLKRLWTVPGSERAIHAGRSASQTMLRCNGYAPIGRLLQGKRINLGVDAGD
jgi:hypothetical protein